jgi:3-hydroxyacyl-[acyl-carrier-protein] dehydratase
MRFYMIDRVLSYDPWKSIHAQKLTSRNEIAGWAGTSERLIQTWDGQNRRERTVANRSPYESLPTMPSALVLEALCQAGSWLLLLSSELRQRAALLSIGSVTYRREVELGAVLEMEGYVASMNKETAVFSGHVLVQGTPVLEASEIMCVLIDAQELEDPADTARMKHLLLQGGKAS